MKDKITKDEILKKFLIKVSRRKPDYDMGFYLKRWWPKNEGISLHIPDVDEEREVACIEYHGIDDDFRLCYYWNWGYDYTSYISFKRLPKKELIKLVEKF